MSKFKYPLSDPEMQINHIAKKVLLQTLGENKRATHIVSLSKAEECHFDLCLDETNEIIQITAAHVFMILRGYYDSTSPHYPPLVDLTEVNGRDEAKTEAEIKAALKDCVSFLNAAHSIDMIDDPLAPIETLDSSEDFELLKKLLPQFINNFEASLRQGYRIKSNISREINDSGKEVIKSEVETSFDFKIMYERSADLLKLKMVYHPDGKEISLDLPISDGGSIDFNQFELSLEEGTVKAILHNYELPEKKKDLRNIMGFLLMATAENEAIFDQEERIEELKNKLASHFRKLINLRVKNIEDVLKEIDR